MAPRSTLGSLISRGLLVAFAFVAAGCDPASPTDVVVMNGYPAPDDSGTGAQAVVYRAWWLVSYFPDPIAAGARSDAERVVPGSDYVYAVLAPDWDPTSSTVPSRLIPVRTRDVVSPARGSTTTFVLDAATLVGDCAAGSPLSQDDADFVTTRIFPTEFAGLTYDAATCTLSSPPSPATDAGGSGDAGTPEDGGDGG